MSGLLQQPRLILHPLHHTYTHSTRSLQSDLVEEWDLVQGGLTSYRGLTLYRGLDSYRGLTMYRGLASYRGIASYRGLALYKRPDLVHCTGAWTRTRA